MAVFHYIEGWYNTHRRHSSIDYYAPIAFERRYTSSIQHVELLTVHQIGATPVMGNVTPSDVLRGRREEILQHRREVQVQTIERRRQHNTALRELTIPQSTP